MTVDRANKHPLYMHAEGGIGKWEVEVWLPQSVHTGELSFPSDTLLCTLHGARKQIRTNLRHRDCWRVDFATHATDVEHDRSHFVDLWVASPEIVYEYDDCFTATGFLFDLAIPTQEWLDEQLASTDMCGYCTGGESGEPHPITEYMPPHRKAVELLRTPYARLEFKRVSETSTQE